MNYNFYDRSKEEPCILERMFAQLPPLSPDEKEAALQETMRRWKAARAKRVVSEKRRAQFKEIARDAIRFAEEQVWNLSIESDEWYGKLIFSAPCFDFTEADSVSHFCSFLQNAAVTDIMVDGDGELVNVELFYALFDTPQT